MVTELKVTSSNRTFSEMQINSLEYVKILVSIEEEYEIVFTYDYYENFVNERLEMLIEFIYEKIEQRSVFA